MKRRLFIIVIAGLLFLSGILVSSVFAQERESVTAPDIIPFPPGREPGFFGQDHGYTVVFRGNGEAVVSARIVFTNKGEEPLSEISLRVPRVQPSQISVYQVIREKVCVRYEPTVYDPATRKYLPQICAEYQDPDYYQTYYQAAKYQKADYELDIDTLKIALPSEVDSNKSGSFFVYFRARGYVKKNVFGTSKFTFETLEAEDDIRSLRVGISTDSDLVLKGTKGEVQYRFDEAAVSSLGKAGLAAPEANVAFDRFYQNIGQGRITKTASNLAPLESYTVEGSFATNRLKLFAKEIIVGAAMVVVFLAIVVGVLRIVFKKLKGLEVKTKEIPGTAGILAISAGIGFVSAFLISGYTTLIILIGGLISRSVSYQYNAVFVLFLLLISFGVYGLLLFGPALYLGVKKGVGWGITTAVLTIVWLIIFLVLVFLFIFLIGKSSYPGPIVPLLEGFAR